MKCFVDSSGVLFKQYYGFSKSEISFTGHLAGSEIDLRGVIGYIKQIFKASYEYGIEEGEFIHILDGNTPSEYRLALYSAYKANRKEKDEGIKKQKQILPFFIHALDWHFIQMEGVESDDVIGTLVSKEKEALILSYDKDLMQLTTNNVNIIRNEKDENGRHNFMRYTPQFLMAKYGIYPESFVDLLAFAGDTADNIPGVKGISEKTAMELLKKYGNAEEIVKHLDELPKRQKSAIENHLDELFLSKKLALILKNVDVKMHPNTLTPSHKQVAINLLIEVFTRLNDQPIVNWLKEKL